MVGCIGGGGGGQGRTGNQSHCGAGVGAALGRTAARAAHGSPLQTAPRALTCLLWVVVRPHFVDPQRDCVAYLVLHSEGGAGQIKRTGTGAGGLGRAHKRVQAGEGSRQRRRLFAAWSASCRRPWLEGPPQHRENCTDRCVFGRPHPVVVLVRCCQANQKS
jgi:hypothetical protein